MRTFLPLLVAAVFAAGHASAAVQESLQLEVRFDAMAAPPECDAAFAQARDALAAGKLVALEPRATAVLNEEVLATPEARKRKHYMAPVGTHVAVWMKPGLDLRNISLYVDCKSGEAIVAARGGVADTTAWFGPFAVGRR